jgi:hypothetical protein
VAQESALTTGQYGGHPAPVLTASWGAHGENPAVKRVEEAATYPVSDRRWCQPEPEQLLAGGHTMLPSRHPADLPIDALAI